MCYRRKPPRTRNLISFSALSQSKVGPYVEINLRQISSLHLPGTCGSNASLSVSVAEPRLYIFDGRGWLNFDIPAAFVGLFAFGTGLNCRQSAHQSSSLDRSERRAGTRPSFGRDSPRRC